VFRNVGHQVEFDWGRGLGIRCLHPAKPHLERLYDAAHALARWFWRSWSRSRRTTPRVSGSYEVTLDPPADGGTIRLAMRAC